MNASTNNKNSVTSNALTYDVCKKSFKTKSQLNVHQRIDTKEKSFNCTVCDKSFTKEGSVKTHMLLHTAQWAGKWPLTIFATKQLKQDFYLIV